MPDAIQVLKPGWRALDVNGNPYPGALLQFHNAGTSNAREVFSDYALTASLGVEIECDAGGYPTSNGNIKVEIYTGATPYKLTLKSADGVTIWTHDNIVGAVDTSGFLVDADIVPSTPTTNTSANQAPLADDKGKLYNVNCSGGDVTILLDNASDLGNGWFIKVRHDGSANAVLIVTTSGELVKIGSHVGVTAFALVARGQTVTISCDGVGFKVEESSPALFAAIGIIQIADRLSVAPVSPEAGNRYIATGAGAWGSLDVVEHDIVEANGQGGWFKITPAADCGWQAYVQDEDQDYRFIGSAWATATATALRSGSILLADAAAQEALTAGRGVTSDLQHRHPGHSKAGGNFNGDGTPAFRDGDYGMGAITDHGTGNYTLSFDTAFNDTNYWATAFCRHSGAFSDAVISARSSDGKTTSTMRFRTTAANSATEIDPPEVGISFWGDYA